MIFLLLYITLYYFLLYNPLFFTLNTTFNSSYTQNISQLRLRFIAIDRRTDMSTHRAAKVDRQILWCCYIGRYKLLHVVILLDCACCCVHVNGTRPALQRTQLYLQECARMAYSRALDFRRLSATLVNYIRIAEEITSQNVSMCISSRPR